MGSNKLEVLLKKADKKYGKGTIIRGKDYPIFPRFSTGVFAIDVETGGGIPKGRLAMFTGSESTAKTTIAKNTVATAQKTCRNCLKLFESPIENMQCDCEDSEPHKCVYIDMEGTFDPIWFRVLGGDLDSLYVSQPQFSEQAVDIVEAVIRTGDADLVVIDSLAMMSPAVEIEDSAEDQIMGVHARLINRMMRSIQAGFNSLGMEDIKKPSVILINQPREKIGVMFGNPITYPGGRGQLHAASIMLDFTARPSERIQETLGGSKVQVGQKVRFKVTKNKTFPPNRSGHFTLYTDDSEEYGVDKGHIDNEIQIVRYGTYYGIIDKNGAWYSYEDGDVEIKEQGEKNIGHAVLEHPDIMASIREQILEQIKDV